MGIMTIHLDDELLERVRRRAEEKGTSVDGLVRRCLETQVPLRTETQDSWSRLLEIAGRAGGHSRGRTWTRDELHERS